MNDCTRSTLTRKREVPKQELSSFISRSLSCLFTETATIQVRVCPSDSDLQGDPQRGPLKRPRFSSIVPVAPQGEWPTNTPLPTTISMSHIRQSRSIGKLSQTDSLVSMVGSSDVTVALSVANATTSRPCYSIVSSDCSIRSDLDAFSFDSRARLGRQDSDSDSLSYSDDSAEGDPDGWSTDQEEEEDGPGNGEGGIFF